MEEAANGRGRRERVEGGRGVGGPRARETEREGEGGKEKVRLGSRGARARESQAPLISAKNVIK